MAEILDLRSRISANNLERHLTGQRQRAGDAVREWGIPIFPQGDPINAVRIFVDESGEMQQGVYQESVDGVRVNVRRYRGAEEEDTKKQILIADYTTASGINGTEVRLVSAGGTVVLNDTDSSKDMLLVGRPTDVRPAARINAETFARQVIGKLGGQNRVNKLTLTVYSPQLPQPEEAGPQGRHLRIVR